MIDARHSRLVTISLSEEALMLLAGFANLGIAQKQVFLAQAEPGEIDDPASERSEIRHAEEALQQLRAVVAGDTSH